MPELLYCGVFKDEDDVLGAVKGCREAGFDIHDVYTPYAVHGLDRAMGLPFSKITWVTFGCGLGGLTFGLSLMSYVTHYDWGMNIGGKSTLPMPAFIPVLFELTVLIGGLCTMLGLFIFCRLYPGKNPKMKHPRLTDDRFMIALKKNQNFNIGRASDLFHKFHAEQLLDLDSEYDCFASQGGTT